MNKLTCIYCSQSFDQPLDIENGLLYCPMCQKCIGTKTLDGVINYKTAQTGGRRMRIYIASPYTAPTEEQMLSNAIVQVDTGIKLMLMGHKPFMPLLTHWLDIRAKQLNINFTWEQYMDWCIAWLNQCDAILYLGSSKGADMELDYAEKMGLKIFYKLEEVPNVQN